MCKLTEREKEVLEVCLTSADDIVAAAHLGVTPKTVANFRTRIRRKEAKARKFLTEIKRYERVLHPPRRYKKV
jgi:FixJ family two-component response regulator